jgi:hypothetical protein
MGLDQYAYVASKVGARDEYYEEKYDRGNSDANQNEYMTELAYWRKHPNLQGWMERLWNEKGCPGVEQGFNDVMFNGIELELTFDDVVKLEYDIKNNNLPATSGFFYGSDADDYYKNQDLEFVYEAKSRLFLGQKVFYNSSW